MTQRFDRVVLALVILLILIGLTAVSSSTLRNIAGAAAQGKALGTTVNQFSYLKKQFLTVLIGIIAMFRGI